MPSRTSKRKCFQEEALPHMGNLYRMAVRLCSDRAAAEDLVQETYKEAWRNFSRYQPGTNCRAWLFQIQFNLAGRMLRDAARNKSVSLNSAPEEKLAEFPRLDESLAAEKILEVIDGLPEHYRVMVLMADVEEFSYREISEIAGVPIGTVMSRLSRARNLIREKLKLLQTSRARQEG